jgi:crotonobetainyl-CoA:carnitine CoA-transferase CaiB-like acyl-CoA transferase
VLADKFWAGLCTALELDLAGRPELGENAERLQARDEIDEAIAVALSGLTVTEAMARLEQAGVPHAPVNGILDALSTPYVQEQALVATVQAGQGSYPFIRTPLGSARSPLPAPMLGEHTDEVAAELAARRSEHRRLPRSEPAP